MNIDELLKKYSDLPHDYVKAIFDYSINSVNRRFLNDSGIHAKLLIEVMLDSGKPDDEIRIYSGSLNADCYPDALSHTESTKIKILVDDIAAGEIVLNKLDPSVMKKIEIRKSGDKDHTNHFYTVGQKCFRYELDHGKATAIANFNEPTSASTLNDRFDKMWSNADHN